MKKLFFFTLISLIPIFVQSQVCVTKFQGDDFGLADHLNNIVDIEMDRFGNIWFSMYYLNIGTDCQVGRFDRASGWAKVDNAFLLNRTNKDIAIDKEDSIWIATSLGLGIVHISTLEGRTMTPDNSGLPEPNVTAVAVDSNNVKWLGFNSGEIYEYIDGNFTPHHEWGNSPVKTIEVASDGSIWVGMGGTPGIVRYKDGIWTSHSEVKNIQVIRADRWGRVMVASSDSMIIFQDGVISGVVHAGFGNDLQGIAVGEAGGIWACTKYKLLLRNADRFIPYSDKNSAVPPEFSGPIEFDSDNQLWFGYKYTSDVKRTAAGYLYRPALQEKPVISADKNSLVFCYGDSLTLQAEEDMARYVWPDGSNADSYRIYDADTVEVAVERDNSCFYYDTVRVNVQKVYEKEKVCAVSVDTSQKNIIIWEKTPEVGTDYYHIYREMAARDSFEFIGEVPAGSLSTFVDPDFNPREQSVRYKISSVDTCGNESGQSFYHQTVHLRVGLGGLPSEMNLEWNHYEGLSFPSYHIYRGTSPDSMELHHIISSSYDSWTDLDVFDTMYYLIAIPLSDTCRPSGTKKKGTGPYHHSLSNMDDNKKKLEASFIGKLNAALEIRSYPNPFSEFTRIEYPDLFGGEHTLRVYSLSGQVLREISGITGGEVFFHRENLKAGYYVFELEGKKLYRGKFVIR